MHKEGNFLEGVVLVDSPIYGLIAEFSDPDQLIEAANIAREAGYRNMDAYSPFPIHGLAEAIGFEDGRMPWFAFFGGMTGLAVGFMLLYYVNVIDYPLNVGGRPLLSWPQFIPIMFECTVLATGLTVFIAQWALNGLPRPYHSIFNARNFERASQDKFFLCIEARDNQFDVIETARFLSGLGADHVSEVEQ
jgi:hypothetical protein